MITIENERLFDPLRLVVSAAYDDEKTDILLDKFNNHSKLIQEMIDNSVNKAFEFNTIDVYFSLSQELFSFFKEFDDSFYMFDLSIYKINTWGEYKEYETPNFKDEFRRFIDEFSNKIMSLKFQEYFAGINAENYTNYPVQFFNNPIEYLMLIEVIDDVDKNYAKSVRNLGNDFFVDEFNRLVKSDIKRVNDKLNDVIHLIYRYSTINSVDELIGSVLDIKYEGNILWNNNINMFTEYILNFDQDYNRKEISERIFELLDISPERILSIVYPYLTKNTAEVFNTYGIQPNKLFDKINLFMETHNIKVFTKAIINSIDKSNTELELLKIDIILNNRNVSFINLNDLKFNYNELKFIIHNYDRIAFNLKDINRFISYANCLLKSDELMYSVFNNDLKLIEEFKRKKDLIINFDYKNNTIRLKNVIDSQIKDENNFEEYCFGFSNSSFFYR